VLSVSLVTKLKAHLPESEFRLEGFVRGPVALEACSIWLGKPTECKRGNGGWETDRVGFEPTIPLRVYRFSRQTPRNQNLSLRAGPMPIRSHLSTGEKNSGEGFGSTLT
jgi:hypothetical protein